MWGANHSDLCMPMCVERLKAFRQQFPRQVSPAIKLSSIGVRNNPDGNKRQVQNDRSQLFNTAAHRTNGQCGCNSSFPDCGGNQSALFVGPNCTGPACDLVALKLTAPESYDFTPTRGSPLVDAGAIVPPYTGGFVGSAPDIGAYEHGGSMWRAGCEGLDGGRCTEPKLLLL